MKITALAKATKDCFTDFMYRDSSFDNWLPKEQPAQEGEISVIKLDSPMTFLQMAQKYLGSNDIEVIKKHILTLPMVEKLVAEYESDIETTGWTNFFFLENLENKGGVSVGGVDRDGRGWFAFVDSLDRDYVWYAGSRLLVCNLDTKTLSPSDPVLNLDQALELVKSASYEVTPSTLEKKFQKFRETHGSGSGKTYWKGLADIAAKHFEV